ncbi:MAG: proton-conducting transporter membrane subunit [bacterium]|nr:proton-conducting transporter membrane subunit [bacterium]
MFLSPNYLPLIAIVVPIISILIRPIVENKKHYLVACIAHSISFLCVLGMYPSVVMEGKTLEILFDTGLGPQLHFRADLVGFYFAFVASFMWVLASIYSIEYMKKEHEERRFNIFSSLSFAGMLGVVFTGNLFSLYLFFELLTVSSSVLVFHEQSEEAIRTGLKYLFMGVFGGLLLLFAIIATYSVAGHGDLNNLGIKELQSSPLLMFIFWGYIIGFGVKAGMWGVHIWLPSAHPIAPSPASALLSGVMIKAGAYGIFRTVYNIFGAEFLGQNHVFMINCVLMLGLAGIFYGSAAAITQKELKKMLAYSSISQIGYIIMGIALLTKNGLEGALIHVLNHAIFKGLLFFCAGAFIYKTGKRQLSDLKGIGKIMPKTTLMFTIAAASIIGLPLFNGFVGKWFLAWGALDAAKAGVYGKSTGIVALGVLLLSSLMNLVYYAPIVIGAWFGEAGEVSDKKDPNFLMLIPMYILGALILILGIAPAIPVSICQRIAGGFFQ